MRARTSASIAFLALTGSALAQSPCEVFRLENPIAPADGTFGQALALDGSRLLVGMPTELIPGDTGSAYVFERTAAGWTQTAKLTASDAELGDYVGWAVAIDGNVALVTQRGYGTLSAKGAVLVFQRQPTGQWLEKQKLTVDDPECWGFGASIAFEGTRAAIAAKGAGSVGPKGRVFVFELEDGVFVEQAKIQPSLDDLADWFGASVALDGDRLAVGAPKGGTGRAYVFDRQPDGTWVEQALLLPDDLASADQYGYSVSVRGDRVAVGALAHDIPFLNGGAVYVWRLVDGNWTLEQKLTAQSPFGTLPRFGHCVLLEDDELLVSAAADQHLISHAGAVYRFALGESGWTEVGKFYGSEPLELGSFGWAMARDGDDLIVGAPAASTPGPARVHVFSFEGGAHLAGQSASISMSSGGAQHLQLGACPEHAGDFYFLLGTASGVAPPLPLNGALLPLVLDGYLAYTLAAPNSAMLQSTLGVLDPWGRATATIALPPAAVASGVGMMLHHAYVVLDATTLDVELASNATPLRLVP